MGNIEACEKKNNSADDVTKTKASEDLLETKTTKKTVKEATKAKTVQLETLNVEWVNETYKRSKDGTEKLANEAENTAKQETDSSDNLEERLGKETPERVDLLLGVGHTLELALALIDTGLDLSRKLLQNVGKVSFLRSSLTSSSLLLSIATNATIRVKTADDAVALSEKLSTRLDLSDKFLLVTVLRLLSLSSADLVVDGLADGSESLQSLLNLVGELLSKLLVLLSLILLSLDISLGLLALDALLLSLTLRLGCLFRLLLLGDVLKKGDVTNDAALLVKDIAVLINLLALAVEDLTAGELANDVTVSVNNVALTVHLAASKRVVCLLLLRLLPALGFANNIAIGVDNLAVIINRASDESLSISNNKSANSLASLVDNLTILGDGTVLELGERTILLATALALRDKLSLADDVSRLTSDVSIAVRHASDKLLDITLNDTTVSGLVDTLASKSRVVDRLLLLSLGSFPALGLTDGVTAAVENVTILIDLAALELLGVTLNNLANLLALVHDTSIRLDGGTREVLEGSRGLLFAFGGRDRLTLADDLSRVVPDITVLVGTLAEKLLQVTFNNLSDNVAVGINKLADLVNLAALESGSVLLLDAIPLLEGISLADDVAISPDLTVLVGLKANELLDLTLSDLADGISLVVSETTILIDNSSLEDGSILLLDTFPFSQRLRLANNLAVSPDLTVLIGLEANELLDLTLSDLADGISIVVSETTLLVDNSPLEDREVLLLAALPLGKRLGLTSSLASLVPDDTLIVRGETDKLLDLTLNDLSEEVTLLVDEVTVLVDSHAFQDAVILLFTTLPLREGLGLADLLASAVPNDALVVGRKANELLDLALNDTSDEVTLVVYKITLLVDGSALENRKVLLLAVPLGDRLSLAKLLASLIPDLTLVVTAEADELLELTFDNLADLVTLVVDEVALLVDSGALEDGEVERLLGSVLSFSGLLIDSIFTFRGLILGLIGDVASDLLALWSLALGILRELLGGLLTLVKLVLSIIFTLRNLALGILGEIFSGFLSLSSLALDVLRDVLRNILSSLFGFRNLVLSSILALSGLALDLVGDTCSILSGSNRLQIITRCLRIVVICRSFTAGDLIGRSFGFGNISFRNLRLGSFVLSNVSLLLKLVLDILGLGDILLVDLGGNVLFGLFRDVLGLLRSVLGLLRSVLGGFLGFFGLGSNLLELVIGIGWCLSILKSDVVLLLCRLVLDIRCFVLDIRCLVLNISVVSHVANSVGSTLGCVTDGIGSAFGCFADSVRGALGSVANRSCHSSNSAGNAADSVSQTTRLLVLGLGCVFALLLVVGVLFLFRLSLSYWQVDNFASGIDGVAYEVLEVIGVSDFADSLASIVEDITSIIHNTTPRD
ncbi:unnamed protein product [Fusarium venenatum]|uniref:Uncharacterized protein n=1 Tax=Fusarium venenatum TaxID=56646 RepID=A0A2L2TJB2_9HYPO|nr:uncharacterized protein FVRRES_02023 [Fusarium venenatum]CEI65511.1 unnamed protein product [Fusarium venenatum]